MLAGDGAGAGRGQIEEEGGSLNVTHGSGVSCSDRFLRNCPWWFGKVLVKYFSYPWG
jgi:hypothetical protein